MPVFIVQEKWFQIDVNDIQFSNVTHEDQISGNSIHPKEQVSKNCSFKKVKTNFEMRYLLI